jgi:hypothetical protein
MKTKHTQGEWKSSNRIFLHVEMGNQWICQLSNLENKEKNYLSDEYEAEEKRLKEEQEANAKLIASAPELLEALLAVQKDLGHFSLLPSTKSLVYNAILKSINS